MKPHEAEKLLGGYATGILTEAEKRVLFAAALKDQSLFESLADEEVFRVLLDDPGVRAQLIDLLSPPKTPARPWWRRPATLGVAASLLAMVTTSLLLLRQPPLPVPVPQPTPTVPAPTLTLPEAPSGDRRKTAPAVTPKSLHRPQADREEAKPAAAPESAPPPPPAMIADEAKELRAMAPAAKKQKAAPIELEAAPKAEAVILPSARAQGSGLAMLAPSPRPTWTLETAAGGKLRLLVTWPLGQHLYLVKRTGAGAVVLSPSDVKDGGRNCLLSRFEFATDPEARLDLYLLASPVADPTSLPEQGSVEGFRERITPTKK